ncbi:MAG: hypothetical protein B7Y95_18500 [Rhizobiales bacterium 32-66-11]|nr:MAG: hypothetical protein B7Y95_18500 [Rhizobiales bacterium 32-66-11]
MVIDYKGYRIHTWIDDDTNHAQMLKGKKGPERLYVDIDPIDGGDGRHPSSKRFMSDIVKKYQFLGTETEQLVQVAKLWVDYPALFASPPGSVASSFKLPSRSDPTQK